MSFKIGDIVTPKNGYVAEGYMFKIINKYYESYPVCKWKYKLQRITQELKIEGISANTLLNEIKYAEEHTWIEDELNFEYRYNETNDAVDTLAYATQVMGVPINQVNIIGDSIQEGIPTPDKPQEIKIKNKNLFDGGIVTNNGLTITKDCASTWVKSVGYTPSKVYEYYKKIYDKEEINMDILDLYKERKEKEIQKEFKEKRQEIMEQDTIQSIIIEMQDQVNAILESEDLKGRLKVYEPDLHTKETEEKFEQLRLDTVKKEQELCSTLDEIRALFEMTEDYNERIKILKKYEILNKDGKLNV